MKTKRKLKADFVRISREVYKTWTAHNADTSEDKVRVPGYAIKFFNAVANELTSEELEDADLGNEIVADLINSDCVPDHTKYSKGVI